MRRASRFFTLLLGINILQGADNPEAQNKKQELLQIDSQLKDLQIKRDSLKKTLIYLTSQITDFQKNTVKSLNREREKFYENELRKTEKQIANLKNTARELKKF